MEGRCQRWIWFLALAFTTSAQINDELKRWMPPFIYEQSLKEEDFYQTDSSKMLPCLASGIPKPEYKWTKDGQDWDKIPLIEGTGSIDFKLLDTSDEGTYQCIASNLYGRALSRVVHLRRARLFKQTGSSQVVNHTVMVGKYLMLPFSGIDSVPNPAYSWKFAKTIHDVSPTNLPDTTRRNVDTQGNLHFAYVEMDDTKDGGIYMCAVYNPYQQQTSDGCQARIIVTPDDRGDGDSGANNDLPGKAFATEAPLALREKDIVMKCLFKGNPAPSVSWEKKDGRLPSGRYQLDSHDTMLTISDARDEDSGTYICKGTNDHGIAREEITVKVEAVPFFREQMKSMNVTNGETVTFRCDVDGVPEVNIQWLRNGEPLDLQANPRMALSDDERTLTISDVRKEPVTGLPDLMVLQCNASNAHGHCFGNAYLNVLEPTEITVDPENVTMDYPNEVNFDCGAVGDDLTPVTIEWLHNGEQIIYREGHIEKTDENSLRIFTANNFDDLDDLPGVYTCVATNGLSQASSSASLWPSEIPPVDRAGFMWYWWLFLLLAILLLLILSCVLCYMYVMRNRGDEYDVDEKERQMGNDPEQALVDAGYHEFQRAPVMTHKGSRASLGSTAKLDASDDDRSLDFADFGEFGNEDGSFIGKYNTAQK